MKYKILLISILTLVILVILGNYRWEYRESDEVFSYKYDRWAKQLWVEFTPEIGTNDIIDIPMVYTDKLSTDEFEEYLMKLGLTGRGVNIWVHRTRLSDAYIGLLTANIAIIILSCLNIIGSTAHRHRNPDRFSGDRIYRKRGDNKWNFPV